MKRNILVLIVFALILSACSKREGRYVSYYEDGQLMFFADFKEGKLDGEMGTYYQSGQEHIRANFVKGALDGKLTRRNKWGRIDLEMNFNMDLLHGSFLKRYKNDRLFYTGVYKDGKGYGPALRFYENGSIWGYKVYDSLGRIRDTMRVWYEGGNLLMESIGGRGQGMLNYYNEDQISSLSGFMRDGLFYKGLDEEPYTGILECYYNNGQLAMAGNFINGKKTGDWKGWYFTGQKCFEGKYADSRVTGWWKYWNKDGDMIMSITYDDGITHYSVMDEVKNHLVELAKTGEKLK